VTVIGRLTYLGVPFGIIMIVVGMAQAAANVSGGVATLVIGVLTALLSAAAGGGLLAGKEWARRLYLWLAPLGVAGDLVGGEYGIVESGFNWWRFAFSLGAYCVYAFFLTRPKTVAFFKRQTRVSAAEAL
jgi:hypothetical protein